MKQVTCPFEIQVTTATRTRQWTTSLRSHASMCPVCSATMSVNQWIQEYSREPESRTFPSHRLIWLKAQYARKQERLSKLDIAALGGMWVIGIAGFVGLSLWKFPHLFSDALDAARESFPDLANLLSHGTSLGISVGILIMVWALTRDTFAAKR
jgi:hypothetical protein